MEHWPSAAAEEKGPAVEGGAALTENPNGISTNPMRYPAVVDDGFYSRLNTPSQYFYFLSYIIANLQILVTDQNETNDFL